MDVYDYGDAPDDGVTSFHQTGADGTLEATGAQILTGFYLDGDGLWGDEEKVLDALALEDGSDILTVAMPEFSLENLAKDQV